MPMTMEWVKVTEPLVLKIEPSSVPEVAEEGSMSVSARRPPGITEETGNSIDVPLLAFKVNCDSTVSETG